MSEQNGQQTDTPRGPYSHLQEILESGRFAVAAELGPPKSADRSVIEHKAQLLGDWADAINVTDNQTAVTRMSSMAACAILVSMGLDAVFQITCRDRNRLAIQNDILGASALGIRNVLCLTGDDVSMGNHPDAKRVHDLGSIEMVQAVQRMRDHGKFISNDDLKGEGPQMFIGAASNPFAPPYDFRPVRLAKKIRAGAQFIQTQCVFDIERFKAFMVDVRQMGLHEQVHILPGVMPVKKAAIMKFMAQNVPGMSIPQELVERMEAAADPEEEGIRICVETIQALREIEGVHGVHIMALMWEKIVPEIVQRAKLREEPVT